MQRWLWLFVLAMTVWSATTSILDERWVIGLIVLVVGAVLSWWVSPWKGGRTIRHADVTKMPRDQRPVVIYWRPGCQFCARLKRTLGPAGKQAHWVNIWQDRDGADFVRSQNDGNETVPTVVLDGIPTTNPDPEVVLARIDS
ncbi:MAG: glutaredoxin domain-containing protein [Ornithinimicrobium sp.]